MPIWGFNRKFFGFLRQVDIPRRRAARIVAIVMLVSVLVTTLLIALARPVIDGFSKDRIVESTEALITKSSRDDWEVVIVPGAYVSSTGVPSLILTERMQCAKRLFDAGVVKKILVSGDHGQHRYDEVGAMRAWFKKSGVADEVVFTDHAGFNTRNTMQRAALIFQVKSAIICTQAFHLPRSIFLARRAGINVVGVVVDTVKYPEADWYRTREFLAKVKAFTESYILHSKPTFLGPVIPISGLASASHD